jgi:hypothetical protein
MMCCSPRRDTDSLRSNWTNPAQLWQAGVPCSVFTYSGRSRISQMLVGLVLQFFHCILAFPKQKKRSQKKQKTKKEDWGKAASDPRDFLAIMC